MLTLLLRAYENGLPGSPNRQAIATLLRGQFVEPMDGGWADIYAGDGGSARIDLTMFHDPDAFTETAIEVELLTPGLSDLVHQLASAGGMTIIPSNLDDEILLTDGDQAAHLPDEEHWWAPHTCVDGQELHWRLTRDTGPSRQGPPKKQVVDREQAIRSLFGLRRLDR